MRKTLLLSLCLASVFYVEAMHGSGPGRFKRKWEGDGLRKPGGILTEIYLPQVAKCGVCLDVVMHMDTNKPCRELKEWDKKKTPRKNCKTVYEKLRANRVDLAQGAVLQSYMRHHLEQNQDAVFYKQQISNFCHTAESMREFCNEKTGHQSEGCEMCATVLLSLPVWSSYCGPPLFDTEARGGNVDTVLHLQAVRCQKVYRSIFLKTGVQLVEAFKGKQIMNRIGQTEKVCKTTGDCVDDEMLREAWQRFKIEQNRVMDWQWKKDMSSRIHTEFQQKTAVEESRKKTLKSVAKDAKLYLSGSDQENSAILDSVSSRDEGDDSVGVPSGEKLTPEQLTGQELYLRYNALPGKPVNAPTADSERRGSVQTREEKKEYNGFGKEALADQSSEERQLEQAKLYKDRLGSADSAFMSMLADLESADGFVREVGSLLVDFISLSQGDKASEHYARLMEWRPYKSCYFATNDMLKRLDHEWDQTVCKYPRKMSLSDRVWCDVIPLLLGNLQHAENEFIRTKEAASAIVKVFRAFAEEVVLEAGEDAAETNAATFKQWDDACAEYVAKNEETIEHFSPQGELYRVVEILVPKWMEFYGNEAVDESESILRVAKEIIDTTQTKETWDPRSFADKLGLGPGKDESGLTKVQKRAGKATVDAGEAVFMNLVRSDMFSYKMNCVANTLKENYVRSNNAGSLPFDVVCPSYPKFFEHFESFVRALAFRGDELIERKASLGAKFDTFKNLAYGIDEANSQSEDLILDSQDILVRTASPHQLKAQLVEFDGMTKDNISAQLTNKQRREEIVGHLKKAIHLLLEVVSTNLESAYNSFARSVCRSE